MGSAMLPRHFAEAFPDNIEKNTDAGVARWAAATWRQDDLPWNSRAISPHLAQQPLSNVASLQHRPGPLTGRAIPWPAAAGRSVSLRGGGGLVDPLFLDPASLPVKLDVI